MESMYTLLGTSQQPKLLSSPSDRLFIVTRKPLTPLPTIAAEKDSEAREGGELQHSRASPNRKDGARRADRPLAFEMGKRVKRNGTTATTVKVVFPGCEGEQDSPGHIGSEFHSTRTKKATVRRSNSEKLDKVGHSNRDDSFAATDNKETEEVSKLTTRSFSHIHTMGGKRGREHEIDHSDCFHPHVTRVDILFKPLPNSEESSEDQEPKAHQVRRRRPVNKQLKKQTSFGSKDSISLSTSNLLVRPSRPEPYTERDELTDSFESSSTEGTWHSAAYTAKNTRIEFARSLHVPRPFVVRRKAPRWSRKPQEKVKLCSRHLHHTRALQRRMPSPLMKDDTGCPDQLADPWLVTPGRRRFEPSRPLALTSGVPSYALNITKLRHNGTTIGPAHPHLHLAAINSVYNCNRLPSSGSLTPPVSEADSTEYLDDYETFNLKVKMDLLINQFRELCKQ